MISSLRFLAVSIFLLTVSAGVVAQSTNPVSRSSAVKYDIATWQGFRSAAVSYTFDDNCPNQLLIAVPMFDSFGFKLTLFTVTSSAWGWRANWSGLKAAADEGHEIASHTIDHQPLGGMSDSLQRIELKLSQDTINARITGHSCTTFAYPNCILGNSTLVAQNYIAARGCSGQIVSSTPGDFMNISSFVCGNQGLNAAIDMEAKATSAASSNGWCVYLMHGINNNEPGAYSPVSQDTIQATLQYFKTHQDEFWVAPFGTVARYIQERYTTTIIEPFTSDDSIIARAGDAILDTLPRVPLTLRRPLPVGWDSVIVRQSGVTVPSSIVKVDTIPYVIFNAIPNATDITIVNETGTSVGMSNEPATPKTFGLLQNYPNPFNPTTTIRFQLAGLSRIRLAVYDLLGREIALIASDVLPSGLYAREWDASTIPSGVYLCMLRAESFVDTKKLVLMK